MLSNLYYLLYWHSSLIFILKQGQEIPARTGLGATSALAVVTIGFGGKTKPQVAYATALDVFIIICSVLVFFALAEFALLSFLDVYIRRYKEKEQRREKLRKAMERKRLKRMNSCSNCDGFINGGSRHDTRENLVCLENNQHNGDSIQLDWDWDTYLKNSILYNSTLEYLHFIDSVSRKLFPLTFLLCNVIYWTSYIYVL